MTWTTNPRSLGLVWDPPSFPLASSAAQTFLPAQRRECFRLSNPTPPYSVSRVGPIISCQLVQPSSAFATPLTSRNCGIRFRMSAITWSIFWSGSVDRVSQRENCCSSFRLVNTGRFFSRRLGAVDLGICARVGTAEPALERFCLGGPTSMQRPQNRRDGDECPSGLTFWYSQRELLPFLVKDLLQLFGAITGG
jgi:hypothetical protein